MAFLFTVAYFVVPDSAETKLVLYNGTGLLAVLALLYGVHRNKPVQRAAWLWFAAGLSLFLIADVCYYVLELWSENGPPFPSVADAFYLLMYPCVIMGLIRMHRSGTVDESDSSFVVAAVTGIAMIGALWILFVDTLIESGTHDRAAFVTQLAYPMMDVILIAVAARLVVKVHLKDPPLVLILIAVTSLAVADTAYGIVNTTDGFQTGTYIDGFWLAFYVLFAAAALHPASADKVPADFVEGRLTVRQIAVMFVGAMSVLVSDLFWGGPQDRLVTLGATAILIPLILGRVLILTKALERSRDRLHAEATHDALTGLANRAVFTSRTAAALHDRPAETMTVLFIDLDDFKTINDSLGHQAGDILLVEVAARLKTCLGPHDTVARLGGDEFAVLIESPRPSEVTLLARRIIDSLTELIDVGARSVPAACSIGVANGTGAETDADTLLRNADVAMYLAKRRGKGRYELFDGEMHAEALERLDLRGDLQRALAEDQLILEYQPIIELKTGLVVQTEALIRWRHPERGIIPPDRFIPIAEETGLIIEIGAWVLSEACARTAEWRLIPGYEDLGVTVNLSMRQLQDRTFPQTLRHTLRESRLPAEAVVLEITETMLVLDIERTMGVLAELRAIGVKLAIDDFGTGYSSLSYLRSFPIDVIKIDRSFIAEIHRNPTAPALIEAIVNLARALGTYTVAEGIELAAQAERLSGLGCDRAQGYYYFRPLATQTVTEMLHESLGSSDHAVAESIPLGAGTNPRGYTTDVRLGLEEIDAIADELGQLSDEVEAPLMARWPWLRKWAESFSGWTPWMVGVRSREGRLAGCALLARQIQGSRTSVIAMGAPGSICTVLQLADNEASDALAHGIAEAINNLEGAWSLDLEQLSDQDATVLRLSNTLETARLLPEARIPHVAFNGPHRRLDLILSKSMRKQLRRTSSRITAAGLTTAIAFDRGAAITPDLIDEVEVVHIGRDRHLRRGSDLDRPAMRSFWRAVLEGGADEWEVEIGSLRLDGQLAAYVVALLDGDAYRIYDGRMATEFAEFSPGRLIESSALDRALREPRFTVLDWMSGVAPEKLLTTNSAEGRVRLKATSKADQTASQLGHPTESQLDALAQSLA